MSLNEDLQEIDGVGEATADKIMAVVADHDTDSGIDPAEVQRVAEMLERGSVRAAQSRLSDLL